MKNTRSLIVMAFTLAAAGAGCASIGKSGPDMKEIMAKPPQELTTHECMAVINPGEKQRLMALWDQRRALAHIQYSSCAIESVAPVVNAHDQARSPHFRACYQKMSGTSDAEMNSRQRRDANWYMAQAMANLIACKTGRKTEAVPLELTTASPVVK